MSKRFKREKLSMEDAPIEEYEKNDQTHINKKMRIVIIILALLIFAVAIVATWNIISPNNVGNNIFNSSSGEGYPAAIKGTNVETGNITLISNNFAYVSDSYFMALSDSAGVNGERRLKYANPTIISKDSRAIIYDRGGKGFQIDTVKETTYDSEMENNIISADLHSSGMYAFITEKEGYTSKLTVYNSDNTQKYAYYFADYYMSCVSISTDGKKAAVSGISAKDGKLISVIYVLDFSKEEPLLKTEVNDNMFLAIRFLDNGNICIVGDKATTVIYSDYNSRVDYDYEDGLLTAFQTDTDKGAVLSVSPSGDGKSCDIKLISKKGNTQRTINTDLQITAMSLSGDNIGVLSQGEITLYNQSGNKLGTWNAGLDARSFCLKNSSLAYVLGVSEIRACQLQ